MANVIQQSIFEFQSTISVSGLGAGFNSLYAKDTINQYLEVIYDNTTPDALYATHPIKVEWNDASGKSGSITRDDTGTTAPYFIVTYTPSTVTPGPSSDTLQIQIVSDDITKNTNDVTVTITFYAKVKANQATPLLTSAQLQNTMDYYTVDPTTPGATSTPAVMTPEALGKFDIRILGAPVIIAQAPDQKFQAIYVFTGFNDQTSIDDKLEYNLLIKHLPEITISTTDAKVTTDTPDGPSVNNATITAGTGTNGGDIGDILVKVPYDSVKGKVVFVSIPATSTNQITATATDNPLYLPAKATLDDTSSGTATMIDSSDGNVEVTLIAPTNKNLTGATKILVP